MKNKIIKQQPTTNDQNYINGIYSNLIQKISLLDQLNQQYKQKQEGHFLKTFMNIIEKLGNQLILAQEAYKNVDFQIKKDSYCLQLAQQLNFFKIQSVNLSKNLNSTKEEVRRLKIDKQTIQSELIFTRNLYQKQTHSYLKLKAQNKDLRNQLKALTMPKHHSVFNSTGISTPADEATSKAKQNKSHSLDNKFQKFQEKSNPQSLQMNQRFLNRNFDTFDSLQMEKKNRNSLTLTPMGQIERFPKQSNLTQRSFRARKQSKERKSNMPIQYRLD